MLLVSSSGRVLVVSENIMLLLVIRCSGLMVWVRLLCIILVSLWYLIFDRLVLVVIMVSVVLRVGVVRVVLVIFLSRRVLVLFGRLMWVFLGSREWVLRSLFVLVS